MERLKKAIRSRSNGSRHEAPDHEGRARCPGAPQTRPGALGTAGATGAMRNPGYVAFLRGINVGGRKPVKMEDLREAFEAMGFQKVKTLLASGNVLFDSSATKAEPTAEKIEERLRKTFGHEIGVLVRPLAELQKLAAVNPFKEVKMTPQTRLYVTFLSEKPKPGRTARSESTAKDFKMLRVSDREVCSAITISPQYHTTELMSQLEKEFGRKVTTRNWNTVLRILDAAASV